MLPAGNQVAPRVTSFAEAQARLNKGDQAGAELICREIVRAQPNDFPAVYLLGIITAASRRHEEAAALFVRAAALRPEEPSTYNNLGNVLLKLNRADESLVSFDRALQRRANYPEAHFNRGNALRELRRFSDALAAYNRALLLNPEFAEAYNNRGKVLFDQLRLSEALESFSRAVQLAPGNAQALTNRGAVLGKLGRMDEALSAHERALELMPDCAAAHSNRGLTLQQLRRLEEAIGSYEHALRLNPNDEQAWYNRGVLLAELERPAEAEVSFQRALQLKPEYAEAHRNRGELHWQHGRHESALECYERALAASPTLPWMYGHWLYARMNVCDWRDWETHAAELLKRIEDGATAAQPFVVFPIIDSPALHRKVAADFVQEFCPPQEVAPRRHRRATDGRIRVGYYSADFREHPVAHLTAALFERHDRRRFEVIAFSFGPDGEDAMRARLRGAFDQFHDVRRQSDREVARRSRELGIDIAVDLTGFTAHHRAGIFAQRAAPVQVNYLGYPGTMAAPYMDYLIADRVLIPPEARANYAEQVAYLPHCYQVNETARLEPTRRYARTELGLPETGFVYCCFNNAFKLTPTVFAGWMRILHAVPGSVLWLAKNIGVAATNLRKAAAAHGIGAERLVFAERVASMTDHLARYRAADLFLDTFPYNAHTTASDALGAGLPVLTLPGQSLASRVASSLLQSLGLPELIASGQDDYERLAIELAQAPDRLRSLRERLIDGRASAILFDVERFTADLQAVYTLMYERSIAGLAPADIQG